MLRKSALLLAIVICLSTLYSTAYIPLANGDIVSNNPEPPQPISPSLLYVTADGSPALLFSADPNTTVVVTSGDDIVGSGSGNAPGITAIVPDSPLSPGLHQLYAYTYVEQSSLQSEAVPLAPIVVTGNDSANVTISDVIPLLDALSAEYAAELLKRIRPVYSTSYTSLHENTWIHTAIENGAVTVTFGLIDSYGYPISAVNYGDFELYTLDADGEPHVIYEIDMNEIYEGIYQFELFRDEHIEQIVLHYGEQLVGIVDVGEAGTYIADVPPLNINIATGASYSLPDTVEAVLNSGQTIQVPVTWNNPQYDLNQAGTYIITGAIEGYAGSVDLTLTVTADDQYRIVLTWGATPTDLDSHLFGSLDGKSSFHIYYANTTYTVTGVTYAQLEHDDTNGYGPETTNILLNGNVGTFRFNVHQFSSQGKLAESDARVVLYKGDQLLLDLNVPQSQGSERYWNVFQMVGGVVYTTNTLQAQGDADLEASINLVSAMIHALPEPHQVSIEHAGQITAARNAVSSEIEPHLVNLNKLLEVEDALMQLNYAQ